jgi:hypothetical protein
MKCNQYSKIIDKPLSPATGGGGVPFYSASDAKNVKFILKIGKKFDFFDK